MRLPDAEGLVVTWAGIIHRNLTGELRHPAGDVIPLLVTVDSAGVINLAGQPPEVNYTGAITPDRQSFRLIARWGVEFIGSVTFAGGAYHLTVTHTMWPEWLPLVDEDGVAPA